jgi:hypothetical protein
MEQMLRVTYECKNCKVKFDIRSPILSKSHIKGTVSDILSEKSTRFPKLVLHDCIFKHNDVLTPSDLVATVHNEHAGLAEIVSVHVSQFERKGESNV